MTKVLLKGLFMAKQRIQLSDHFTYSRLLRFVLPCIGTMLFTSIYGIVDGLCVSNFVGGDRGAVHRAAAKERCGC